MGPNEASIPCPILSPFQNAKSRDQITRFTQKDGESLYDVWERFKEMLRLCPYHGLEKWLIVHTFYNGLSYTTNMIADAPEGGALMNKNYTTTYGLIEDMAQNHYQWTNERATTAVNASPSQKEAGIYEVSPLDHLAAKVDALTQKSDKMSINVVSPSSSILPPCEICGVFAHIDIDFQLGNVAENIEQVSYA